MTNIEKLINVIEENREEIINLSKDCYKKTMNGSCFQGWNVGVVADVEGNIYDYYWSAGTSNTDIFEGKATQVISYSVTNEVTPIEYTEDDITEKEKELFIKFLSKEGYIETIEEWYEELTYDRLSEFDNLYNTDIIERVDVEQIEADTDNYYYESAEESIDNTLDDLRSQLEN